MSNDFDDEGGSGGSGEIGKGKTGRDEDVGHVSSRGTYPRRCITETGGARGVQMSPEDERI